MCQIVFYLKSPIIMDPDICQQHEVRITVFQLLSSVHTRAEYAALNGRFYNEKKTFFINQIAKSTAYYALCDRALN